MIEFHVSCLVVEDYEGFWPRQGNEGAIVQKWLAWNSAPHSGLLPITSRCAGKAGSSSDFSPVAYRPFATCQQVSERHP